MTVECRTLIRVRRVNTKYLFLLSFGKRSQGDQKRTHSIQEFRSSSQSSGTNCTDRQTRWLGTVIIGGSWVEWRERQLGWNEKRVKSQWNFLIPFTPDYADIMKRSERLNYTTGMAGWPKKRHVYYVWFIRSKPTNARGIIFCDDISPPQQRSCRSFAIIVLVLPLFFK